MKIKDKRQRPRKITRGNSTAVPADKMEDAQCEAAAETRGLGGGGREAMESASQLVSMGTKPFIPLHLSPGGL